QRLKEAFGLSQRGTRNLNDDLNDFLALVPLDEVIAIVLDYLANDQEVQELILYLQSEEFHKIVITVEELDEFKLLIKIPEELGIDVNSIINLIHEIIGLPPYAARKNTRRGVGLNGLIDDLIAILPIDDLKALFEKKQQTSPDFKALIDAIQSPEFKSILDKLESLPEFQKLLQNLRDKGVDVDHIIELLKALFGLSRH
ncbi:Protein G12, partial [Cryptotermes secundus]